MAGSLPSSTLARLAGAFFILSAVLGPLVRGTSGGELLPFGAEWGALAVGVAALWAPWDRWPRAALLSIALAAFGLKAFATFESGVAPHLYALHYLVIFMWLGAALGPRVSLVCGAPGAAAYVGPLLLVDGGREVLAAAAVVLPVCIFTGEAAAWLVARMRHAERVSQERARRMGSLVDASLALASSHEPEELARLTALAAADLYRADCAAVLLEDERGVLQLAGDAGWQDEGRERLRDPAIDALLRAAIAGGDDHWPGVGQPLADALGLRRVRVLPLRGSGESSGVAVVGFLGEAEPPEQFADYVGRTLATQAGLGFERVHAARTLLDQSLRDPLTGVGNRRAAMAALERLKAGDVLAVVDLDHFKHVNDSYGQAAGDRVLVMLADHLRSSVRGPDAVFRLGGEEFLLLLPGARRAGFTVVRRLLERWRRQDRVTTFSAGVAIHVAGEAPQGTVARADAALYRAKESRRDCAVLDATDDASADSEPDPEPSGPGSDLASEPEAD